MIFQATIFLSMLASSATAACTGSETNVCMSLDLYAGESGYYKLDRGDFETLDGVSPDITVKVGQKITFDQTETTNWYHPVGFAYAPDGAHGDDWGADENPEVEGAGELQYLIDGEIPTCADAGDTGLDCYEPEFFYPLGDWSEKVYAAELTITEDVAKASHGGVIYYFCHIHSKMSGKIIIKNPDGTPYVSETEEKELYKPTVNDAHDTKCGTTHTSGYAVGGSSACGIQFFGGTISSDYETCLDSLDCRMHHEMYAQTSTDSDDKIVTFMQQMIPHHVNAINMAKLLMKHASAEVAEVEDLEGILLDIINTQNFQVHQFRNYLNAAGKLMEDSTTVPPHLMKSESDSHDSHDMKSDDVVKSDDVTKSDSHDSHDSDDSASTTFLMSTFMAVLVTTLSYALL